MRAVLLFLAFIATAHAQFVPAVPFPHAPSGSAYVGPVDAAGTAAVLSLSIRGATTAYSTGSNQALQAQRASDSHTCNFNIAPSGDLGNTTGCSTGGENGQSAATWLTSTTGTVTSMTDQSGTSTPVTGVIGLLPNCDGAVTCLTFDGTQALNNASATLSQSQPYTMAMVFYMPSSIASLGQGLSTYPVGIGTQNASGCTPNTAPCATAYAGLNQQSISATADAWHSLIVVVNGASSTYSIDGSSPTTVAMDLGSNALTADLWLGAFHRSQYFTGSLTEAFIFASALSGTAQTNLCHNMRLYYNTGGAC